MDGWLPTTHGFVRCAAHRCDALAIAITEQRPRFDGMMLLMERMALVVVVRMVAVGGGQLRLVVVVREVLLVLLLMLAVQIVGWIVAGCDGRAGRFVGAVFGAVTGSEWERRGANKPYI